MVDDWNVWSITQLLISMGGVVSHSERGRREMEREEDGEVREARGKKIGREKRL